MDPITIGLNETPVTNQFFKADVTLLDKNGNTVSQIGPFIETNVTGNVSFYRLEGGNYAGTYCVTRDPTFVPTRIQLDLYLKIPTAIFILEGDQGEQRELQLLVACGSPTTSSKWKDRMADNRATMIRAIRKSDHSEILKRAFSPAWLAKVNAAKAVIPRQQIDQLEAIVQDGMQQTKDHANEAREEAAKLKGTTPDKKAWEQKLEEARKRAIQQSINSINKTFDQGFDYISKNVPPGQQDEAETLFTAGTDLIGIGWDFLLQEFLGVVEDLADLLNDVWGQVTNCANGIVSIASSIGNAISSLFG
ncbi:hypothetical protein PMIN01_12008 [Paraphaeosphaeria minitans]|uniref:Uncharacterized protein n=1 Tax=Paraphaeosphaeria minitans TaxID=565426 RepID=A0A9P6G6H1_9PLEO|nr:hypothetical protein PMIN01_13472 [Paraphaeosphaeria minitans]KAF9730075.1 hypothetical protein PMIN01_12008 [Paraphaeosphaeria minitans]